ncbi:MAG TPA: preprotein translocase subunit SecE [Rubellimicrobium sp.]|nr:preprotein translocase subunit SecE [Rubellimicrobium sp.]
MATEVATQSLPRRAVGFYNDVLVEMRKVTWPDLAQIRQATIGIIVVVLLVGLLIFALDFGLQLVLVRGIPSLFR